MPYFIGLDGGGSKTSVVITDDQANVIGTARSGPSNHLRVGISDAVRAIITAVHDAVAAADIRLEDVEFAYCGIAGSDHPTHRGQMIDALRNFFPRDNFTVDSDARIALTGAVGLGAGIIVIAGTGSVAFGRNEASLEARAGGWGPTLGDEGSGYSIARRGLSAIVRAHDGRGPRTLMTSLLCSYYAMCEPDELPIFVYAPTTHADDIAIYCRVVVDAAKEGDPVAHEILESEGAELGRMIIAVARRLDMLRSTFPVAYVGGAFHAGPVLLGPMSSILAEAAPGARLQNPAEPPVIGAARMAIESASRPRQRPSHG